jgi:hypothetical protein
MTKPALRLCAIIFSICTLVAPRTGEAADDCAAHAGPTGEVRIAPDGHTQIVCKCTAGYVYAAGQCVRIGENLVVDPKYFVDDYERRFLREQISALTAKRQWLQAQRQKLNLEINATTRAAKDVDDATLELLQDSSVQTLNFIDASVQILAGNGAVPAGSAQNIRISITAAKAGLNAISAAIAPADSRRRIEKAGDAAFQFKDILPVRPPGMTEGEWDSFRRASNIIPKMVSIWRRLADSRSDGVPWRELAQSLDDLADFGGQYNAPFKATRAAVHIIEGQATFWMMQRDRDSIDDAFVRLQTAQRYYVTRVGDVDQLLALYQERLQRAGG